MNRMRLVSQYTDYGRKDFWDSSSPVKCVVDEQIFANKRENKQVMLLIEPRTIQPNVYEHALKVANEYEYVFTHDSQLLAALPNAKPILWGGVWCRCENPNKTKFMSMTSSDKEMCELHKERKRIARKYKDRIAVFGTIDGGEFADPIDTLEPYMYSIIIENHIDNIWFTEKLCNCFATKTVPIYYGARDIDKFFNTDGIIVCKTLEELEKRVDLMLLNNDKFRDAYNDEYIQALINQNYELSKKYNKFDEWLYNAYSKEIDRLFEYEEVE